VSADFEVRLTSPGEPPRRGLRPGAPSLWIRFAETDTTQIEGKEGQWLLSSMTRSNVMKTS